MTEVAFHFNAPHKWEYACRLLRKAVARGTRIAVTAEADALGRLDRMLWTFSDVDFLPHCASGSPPDMLSASPVVLCETADAAPHQQLLVNLGAAVPAGFERFDRLIEVVGGDEADRLSSRMRWKHYKDRGYAIARHDLAPKDTD